MAASVSANGSVQGRGRAVGLRPRAQRRPAAVLDVEQAIVSGRRESQRGDHLAPEVRRHVNPLERCPVRAIPMSAAIALPSPRAPPPQQSRPARMRPRARGGVRPQSRSSRPPRRTRQAVAVALRSLVRLRALDQPLHRLGRQRLAGGQREMELQQRSCAAPALRPAARGRRARTRGAQQRAHPFTDRQSARRRQQVVFLVGDLRADRFRATPRPPGSPVCLHDHFPNRRRLNRFLRGPRVPRGNHAHRDHTNSTTRSAVRRREPRFPSAPRGG